MKKNFTVNKFLLTFILIFTMPSFSANILNSKISYNKVYRTERIADSYHFLLLNKNGKYYYLQTNKVSSITAKEIQSPKVLENLKTKQSWGQAFSSTGHFTEKKGKLYTKKYWDEIKVISKKKIKYKNKTFKIQ
ncbi:MAG: hypothetical protein KAG56_09385 [Sulfurovaceae bacterium]|nr:hypothetical protein [Sulfurovaceae bacterium]